MAGRLLEDEPELAYAHAQEAVRRAGRVDVVREAAAITAYRTGRYAEALRELRTARRLNGSNEHVPLMADCERGLGRPERALALAEEHGATLGPESRVELAIVVSGARLDMGQPEAAVAALNAGFVRQAGPPLSWRVAEARAEALRACGRVAEADEVLAGIPEEAFGVEEVELVDLDEDDTPSPRPNDVADADDHPRGPGAAEDAPRGDQEHAEPGRRESSADPGTTEDA